VNISPSCGRGANMKWDVKQKLRDEKI
jgi:hypothetical protein